MELFLDVDGVILDFESAFMDFIRENYIPTLPDGYIPKTWDMENEFKNVDIMEAWDKFINSKQFSCLNLLVDQSSFNALTENHICYLITNIPQKYVTAREENLRLHRLNYKALRLGGHFKFCDDYPDKSHVIAELKTDQKRMIFLDDHPRNCLDVKNNFPASEVYLMSRTHNQGMEDSRWQRVNDWNDFLHKLSKDQ